MSSSVRAVAAFRTRSPRSRSPDAGGGSRSGAAAGAIGISLAGLATSPPADRASGQRVHRAPREHARRRRAGGAGALRGQRAIARALRATRQAARGAARDRGVARRDLGCRLALHPDVARRRRSATRRPDLLERIAICRRVRPTGRSSSSRTSGSRSRTRSSTSVRPAGAIRPRRVGRRRSRACGRAPTSACVAGALDEPPGGCTARRPAAIPTDVLAKYDVAVGDPEELLGDRARPVDVRAPHGRSRRRAMVGARDVRRRLPADALRREREVRRDVDGHRDAVGRPGPADPMSRRPRSCAGRPRRSTQPDAPRASRRRLRPLATAYELEVDGRAAEQWVYSDGLHALSVFRTRGNLKDAGRLHRRPTSAAHACGPVPARGRGRGRAAGAAGSSSPRSRRSTPQS